MYRAVYWLSLLLALAGCRDRRSGAAAADSAGPTAGEAGVEFDAPRLIPSVRAQVARLTEPDGANEQNLTALKNAVGTMVNAMETDLDRVGAGGDGYFDKVKDSLMRELGGAKLRPEEVGRAASLVNRLIGYYEARMRQSAK